jgi:hypothetical protein
MPEIKSKPISKEEATRLSGILDAVSPGYQLRPEENSGNYVIEISINEENLTNKEIDIIVNGINKVLSKEIFLREDFKGKRIYRKRDQLPDPSASSQAEVNRLTAKFQARVSFRHRDAFEEVAKLYPNRRVAIERAIELLLQENDLDFP